MSTVFLDLTNKTNENKMTIQHIRMVFDLEDLTSTEKFIFVALADYADESGICYPSINTISKKTGFSSRSVINSINKIIDKGYLKKTNRNREKSASFTSNEYEILLQKVVNDVHKGSEPRSLGVVNDVHKGSEPRSPHIKTPLKTPIEKPFNIKKKIQKKEIKIYADWLDVNLWNEYLKMRNSIKKPMTDYAEKLMIDKLKKLIDEGESQKEVLEQSIINNWQGLFKKKENNYDNNKEYSHKQTETLTEYAKRKFDDIAKGAEVI